MIESFLIAAAAAVGAVTGGVTDVTADAEPVVAVAAPPVPTAPVGDGRRAVQWIVGELDPTPFDACGKCGDTVTLVMFPDPIDGVDAGSRCLGYGGAGILLDIVGGVEYAVCRDVDF